MGVVAVISPWNYPFCIPMGDIVTALITGCTVCLKPSEAVPAVGALIQELCHDAGLPVWVLQGDGKVGAALIDARPDKVIFTGGSEAGQRVMEAASRHLIPVVMELGGKDPMLVLEDAHLDNAASAAVWGCFTNSGQVCASVKRVYVVDAVADAFIERVKAQCEALRIGDPWRSGTDIGTLISQQQAQKGRAAVERALAEGARLLCGGEVDGCRMAPTVLVDVMPEMQVLQEEIFAPVLPIVRVPSAKAAVIHANNNPFALCASVFSREGAAPIAQQLRAGTVVLNDCTYTYGVPETPWGGVGRSGFGRMHGEDGMRECVYPFHQHVNHAPERRSLWWFPYDAQMIEIAKALGDFYGRGKKLGAFIALLKGRPLAADTKNLTA
jgi:succinate-semialdehyde dehydrogenase/glutarate-semialdehyde dehydrogenase